MKTRKLRLLSALLAVAMMLALLPTAAFAADTVVYGTFGNCGKDGSDVKWSFDTTTGTLTISGTGAMEDYDYESLSSSNINYPWKSHISTITKIVIQSGVTSIGNYAFYGCTNLGTVDLSNATSLEKIGSLAFFKCSQLKNVDLSKAAKLKEIGDDAFNSSGVENVTFPQNSQLAEIGSGAFVYCNNLKNIDIPETVTKIGGSAFEQTNLTSIKIPASVTDIGWYAFYQCRQLESVTFAPDSKLEAIGGDAFSGCSALKTISCESALKEKLSKAVDENKIEITHWNVYFVTDSGAVRYAVEKNKKILKPEDPTRDGWDFAGWYTKNADGKWADEAFDFDNTLITDNMTLYARWTVGGKCGAKGNEDSVHWTLDSDGTMTISGSGAMADYDDPNSQPWADQRSSINRAVIGDEVTSIGRNAFANCPGLEVVELPKNGVLETIKYNAFSWVHSSPEDGAGITEITIPKSVKTIELDAFDGCTKLATVTFAPNSKLETIGSKAFQNTAISEISIPASVKKIGYSKYDGVSFEDGHVFNDCFKLKKVIFESPSSLENVAWSTFAGCFTRVYGTIYGDDNVMSKLKGIVDVKPLTPTVTFETNGGSDVKAKTVENGKTVSAPAVPTRKGYVFTGWYTKDADNEYKPFDFNTTIMDNITLYAQWEEVPVDTYIVTVENGMAWVEADAETKAVAAGESICVPEGATVHVKADETAFDGMAFERWEVRKGEVKLENDRAAETTFTMPAGEVQLEAMPRLESPDDSGWDAATVVTGAVIGTGTAILAYHIGMEVYAEQVLGKDVAVPRTRGEVALLAWQLAGSPEPNAAFELLTDEAKAQQWAVESGLMQPDAEGNFHAEKKLSKLKALRVLDKAKKQG